MNKLSKTREPMVDEPVPLSGTASRGPLRATLAGLVAGCAIFAVLPSSLYRTEAILGVGDATTPLRAAMTEAAAAAAVSKPVISRAASFLIGTDIAAPAPSFIDKATVALRFDRASSRDSRMADTIGDAVGASTGDAPGIVKIGATSPDPTAAARIATAVAEALVSEQDVQAAELRRTHEVDAARRLDAAHAVALAAHKKFTALGGTDVDPAQARAAAAAQTAAAQGRLDVVRTILASGTPPTSDRRDLPQTVVALQAAYLDLSQQLAKTRETYGDRHTTVISLRDGLKRAAASLTAEWKRLSKVAQSELDNARSREASLGQADLKADSAKRAALDEARRNVMVADDAVVQIERGRRDAATDERPYRLVAQAPVPSQATGFGLISRLLLSALAGLVTLLAVRWSARKVWSVPALVVAPASTPSVVETDKETHVDRRSEPVFFVTEPERVVASRARRPQRGASRVDRPIERGQTDDSDVDLRDAMLDLLPAIEAISPGGDVTTVIIASNEAASATASVAIALSAAAADDGLRVLLVEPAQSTAALAALAEADAEPMLVDVFGTLRVALCAERHDGLVHVAPALRSGHRIAAGLARSRDVPLVDDLAAAFDLVVIDGGRATNCTDIAAFADAVLRVGGHPSKRDDDRLLTALGATPDAFLGTVVASAFVPKQDTERVRPVAASRMSDRPADPQSVRPLHRTPPSAAAMPRRRIGAR